MKNQSLWEKWKKKLENDPEVKEAENLRKSNKAQSILDGDLGQLALIASTFGVIKLGQSLSK